jgi:polyribonucleotide nucleotidyltransferase
LVHISEVSWKRLETLDGVLNEGDVIKVKLIGTDPKVWQVQTFKKNIDPKTGETRSSGRKLIITRKIA